MKALARRPWRPPELPTPPPPKTQPLPIKEPPLRLYNSDPGKLDPLDLIRNLAAAAIFLLSTDAALAHHLSRTADVVLRGYSGYNTRWARMVMDRVLDGLAPPQAATVFFGANDASLPDRSSGHQSVPLAEYHDNLRSICTSLKELRSQLYSAAEYFEVSYKNDEQKQIVVSTLKDYAVKALVNTVDHLGSVSFKVNDILDEKVDEVSGTEFRVSCIEQRLRTCQEYINREGLSQQSLVITAPKYHKRYILPVVPKQNMESTTPSSSPASCRLEASTLDEFSMQQSFLFSDSLHASNGAHGQLSPSTSPWMTEPTSIQAYPHHFIPESADLPIQNSLIDIYVRFSNRDSARKVSDEMPEEDVWHCRVWC